ncbi:MAG: adenylosuccinate synthase [bacterium]|nr:adenylosuccinate synthase [Bacteroidales bacterium]MCI6918104.1 adenylosuccinate synthase [bacterium]MDY2650702.1 adenylosuccinate synthase [Candidatus Egerieousia sp.]MDD7071916.1 adenylosuccinate synthase [bacterium]MDD7236209.1 adenylosuccinate synthase [bacterium]
MKVDVVLGLQWGDEGKGKIVDVLAKSYPAVARFQGGPNAGHSLQFEGKKFVLHTVPAGVFREGSINIIGNGVVLDPIIFRQECKEIEEMGVPVTERIIISKKAHLILPTHRILDAASESAMGKGKIGSTLKGIGPTYMDKTGRNGLRIGDTLAENFLERFNTLKEKHIQRLKQYDFQYNAEEHEAEWLDAIKYLKKFKIVDGEYEINEILKTKRVLAEGAQGSMLDVDFGSYPFVTSSSTMCAGACTGLGIAPSKIGKVIGIFKAYCTRVGSGPFPTELLDQVGEELRQKGFEFGATTGRPRRTGWLDLPALKYAIMIDGVTELIMMKADVLDTFDTIKVAVGYKVNGKKSDRVPYDTYATIEPVYKEFKGWKCDLTGVRKREELPANFLKYIAFIEKELGVPVKMVSLGPDRKQTIKL